MVDRALRDFAEAVAGQNREMQWSLSPEIMRRSARPVFDRLYEGKLTAEQALMVAIDYVRTRIENNIKICTAKFTTLNARLDEALHGVSLPAQTALSELFLGLNEEFNWATDPQLMKAELQPTFERVATGHLVADQAVMLFVDNMKARTDTMLDIIKGLVIQAIREWDKVRSDVETSSKAVNGNDQT